MTVPKHTQFAMKALDMAEMFRIRVGTVPVQGSVPFRVELGTPDGPSTGGGRQALQAIKLIPEGAGGTLVAGHANKVIAYDLEISPRTVEVYRANVMTKMQARSLSELVRMAILVR